MSQSPLLAPQEANPFHSSLVEITEASLNILLDLRYATKNNVTGKPIFMENRCFLHADANVLLKRSIELAKEQGLKFKIFDAYRPRAVQEALWAHSPDPMYVTPPEKGSPHTRGVAIDLTLVDASGKELDMGTEFDDFLPKAHHGGSPISAQVAANRYLLLGIMMSAGWDLYMNEWWHYQVFKARDYPLI
jgi:D-alanyl-D-alanine dipeptidase